MSFQSTCKRAMRKKGGVGVPDPSLPAHGLEGFLAWISGVVPDGMDPRSLSRAIVGSCTWGGTQLPLLLLVHDIPLLR